MKSSLLKGFGFGLTSGSITTLGMIVGLNSSTHSFLVVFGGILIIAIADACSDALGMHISQEAEMKNTTREVWESTVMTFITKFIFALTFAIPFVFLTLDLAVYVSVFWGLLIIGTFSYDLAIKSKQNPTFVILEHLSIAVFVILITKVVGSWVAQNFSM